MRLSPRLALMLAVPPLLWASNAVVGRVAIRSIGPDWTRWHGLLGHAGFIHTF